MMNAFYPIQHQTIIIDYTYGDYSEIRSLLIVSDNSYKIKCALLKKLFEIIYCISVDRSVFSWCYYSVWT